MKQQTYIQRFSVPFEYPVYFSRGVFSADNTCLADSIARAEPDRRHRVQVFVDEGLARAQPELLAQCRAYFERYPQRCELVREPELVVGGEKAKNSRKAAEQVMESISRQHLCRQSYVVAIGGGSMLDIVGLSAALVHRGVRLVRIPTTTLAQCDSGVGVKNGIDAYGMKNFAGTFAPPFAVINDSTFLSTLERRYWLGGIAEAFKVAIIRDADFFDFIEASAPALNAQDIAAGESVVQRAAILHLEHIRDSGDPFEFGTARPLDFGHWSAHRLEVISGYRLSHGEAVGIGIGLDACYAAELGRLGQADAKRIVQVMQRTGLVLWTELLERSGADGRLQILRGLTDFQEHLGGELALTLPTAIGAADEVHEVDEQKLVAACRRLKEWTSNAG